jgi:hypothetical protein
MEPVLEVHFAREKDTKNAVRFQEVVAEGRERGVVGTIYVLKTDLEKLGNPSKIVVNISADQE